MTELSVVVPVYGCDACLGELHRRLQLALGQVPGEHEIVFVDDSSPDGAWDTLVRLAETDEHVRLLRLSRNFGQHAAITAGLAETTGRWVAVMDCDLQDPPEYLPELYARAQEGYEVVLSRRRQRRGSWLRRTTGAAYHRLRNRLVKTDMHLNYANLSMISRKVVDSFLEVRDKDRQYLLIVNWLGFPRTTIEVDQDERFAGQSAYSWRSLVRVAVDGMFFQSTVLLRWIVYLGFVLAFAGLLLASYTMIVFILGRHLPDWTGLPVLLLVLAGFIVISTGVTGLYVGKIFDQVKGRPLYVIDSRVVDGVTRGVSADVGQTGPDLEQLETAEPPAERTT